MNHRRYSPLQALLRLDAQAKSTMHEIKNAVREVLPQIARTAIKSNRSEL